MTRGRLGEAHVIYPLKSSFKCCFSPLCYSVLHELFIAFKPLLALQVLSLLKPLLETANHNGFRSAEGPCMLNHGHDCLGVASCYKQVVRTIMRSSLHVVTPIGTDASFPPASLTIGRLALEDTIRPRLRYRTVSRDQARSLKVSLGSAVYPQRLCSRGVPGHAKFKERVLNGSLLRGERPLPYISEHID